MVVHMSVLCFICCRCESLELRAASAVTIRRSTTISSHLASSTLHASWVVSALWPYQECHFFSTQCESMVYFISLEHKNKCSHPSPLSLYSDLVFVSFYLEKYRSVCLSVDICVIWFVILVQLSTWPYYTLSEIHDFISRLLWIEIWLVFCVRMCPLSSEYFLILIWQPHSGSRAVSWPVVVADNSLLNQIL